MERTLQKFNLALVEKNKVINLTAHKTPEDSWINNIRDSLLFIADVPKRGLVLDLGSGCGCPAIPVKIMLPDLNITMIESVNKKVEFLNDVITELGLLDISAIHTRIEDYKPRASFDIVTARAVAPLPTLLEYAMPFLKVGGKLLAFKGSRWQNEIDASANAIRLLGCKVTDVKVSGEARSLVIVEKVKPTDKQYPRGKNLPRLKPL